MSVGWFARHVRVRVPEAASTRSRSPHEHAPHEQAVLVEEHRLAVDDEQREAQGGPGGDDVR